NPADPLQTLKLIKKDNVKINNLFNRLNTYLDRLDVLFEPGCSEPEAIKAWQEFFNHDFWDQEVARESTSKSFALPSKNIEDNLDYRETEEFIEYLFPIEIKYGVRLDCKVDQNGWRVAYLSDILRKGDKLRTKKKLDFYAETDTPKPYEVYWKVKNKGVIAKKRNEVRGQIIKGALEHTENTKFRGGHFVEVYIVKNNTCVARNRIDVPITDM
ncbi:nucleotide-binding domain-containing protein, partial [Bhargavaea beijingensis]|uniref:nucleotide-binding domain-containing protein n=1 Tax=Bhargavaea beijingensis TaxID=426756 RepID=UPI0038736B05|nr:nucleotidyltransferase [Bhargavaea beijingensis]